MIIYVDETGDLGFDFSKPRTSKHFVLTALVVHRKEALRHLITKFEKFKRNLASHEVKGKSTSISNKSILYQLIKKHDWEIFTRVVDKRSFLLETTNSEFYNTMLFKLISKIPIPSSGADDEVRLVLDRCKNKEHELKGLTQRLTTIFQNQGVKTIYIHHADSKKEAGLQLVDVFSHGIYQKYENGHFSWYKAFAHRVREVMKK